MNCSTDSPSFWHQELNQARSKNMFLQTLKNALNLVMTESYAFSSAIMLVDERTSLAVSPIQ